MQVEVVKFLRDLAERLTRLAHACPHLQISQELKGIDAEIMEKAKALEG
jgi:hypothetical protein